MKAKYDGIITIDEFAKDMLEVKSRDDLEVFVYGYDRQDAENNLYFNVTPDFFNCMVYFDYQNRLVLNNGKGTGISLNKVSSAEIQRVMLMENDLYGVTFRYSFIYDGFCLDISISYPKGEEIEDEEENEEE